MNNEQYQILLKKLLKRLDLVAIGALVLLLLVVVYMVMVREASFANEVPSDPAPGELQDKVKGPELDQLRSSFDSAAKPLADDDRYRVLIQNDMFSLKAVKAQEEARKQFNEDVKRASAAFDGQKFDEAEQIVNTVLSKDPAHPEARDLKRRLEARKQATPTPTPAK